METLPYLPLKLIFENLTFRDILHLLWTPHIRNIILEFFKKDINIKDLIRSGLLEIFEKFVYLYPVFVEYLQDFLVDQGMVRFENTESCKSIKIKFLNRFPKEDIEKAFPMKDQLDYLLKHSMYEFCDAVCVKVDLNKTYQYRRYLESSQNFYNRRKFNHTADFLEIYLYDPKLGFRNTLELFEQIPNLCPNRSRILKFYGQEKPIKTFNLISKLFVIDF